MPASQVDYHLVEEFVLTAEAASLFTESLTFEAKEKRNGANIAEAVAALSNSDGGIVLVGVKDRGATGKDRIVGVPKAEHDALASNLHAYIPEAIPEIIPVAMPGGQLLVLVLRVNADKVAHPVAVSGKVLYRIPGHSVPADRRRILELAARDQAAAEGTEHVRIHVPKVYWNPELGSVWGAKALENLTRAGELRVTGGLELPRRALDRPWLGSKARQAALDALNDNLFSDSAWELEMAHAGSLRYFTTAQDRSMQGGASLLLDGRNLRMVTGFRWGWGIDMPLEFLYRALLAMMVAIAVTSQHVARAADMAEPAEPLAWEAWLNPFSSLSAMQVIDFGGVFNDAVLNHFRDRPSDRATGESRTEWHFPQAYANLDREDLDQLARDWIVHWLLDMGAQNFEELVAAWEPQASFRMSDLGRHHYENNRRHEGR